MANPRDPYKPDDIKFRDTDKSILDELQRKVEATELKAPRIPMDADRMAVRTLLKDVMGEDPDREGLVDTPSRVVKAMRELTSGHKIDPKTLLSKTFTSNADEMVTVSGIEFFSLCEHHLLPFHGFAAVSYIPDGKVVGLSKIPRLVKAFARRLQLQEQLTEQIADAMMQYLQPKGVGVRIYDTLHMCQAMRGVESQGKMGTTAVRGIIKDDQKARQEFLMAVGK